MPWPCAHMLKLSCRSQQCLALVWISPVRMTFLVPGISLKPLPQPSSPHKQHTAARSSLPRPNQANACQLTFCSCVCKECLCCESAFLCGGRDGPDNTAVDSLEELAFGTWQSIPRLGICEFESRISCGLQHCGREGMCATGGIQIWPLIATKITQNDLHCCGRLLAALLSPLHPRKHVLPLTALLETAWKAGRPAKVENLGPQMNQWHGQIITANHLEPPDIALDDLWYVLNRFQELTNTIQRVRSEGASPPLRDRGSRLGGPHTAPGCVPPSFYCTARRSGFFPVWPWGRTYSRLRKVFDVDCVSAP